MKKRSDVAAVRRKTIVAMLGGASGAMIFHPESRVQQASPKVLSSASLFVYPDLFKQKKKEPSSRPDNIFRR